MKKCAKCGMSKDMQDFCTDKKNQDGRSNQCRRCKSLYDESFRPEIKQQICSDPRCSKIFTPPNRRGHKYCSKRCHHNYKSRLWQKTSKARKKIVLKHVYNLTVAEHQKLLADQLYLCAICRKPFGEETPSTDHDHACCPGQRSCGKCIRGLVHDQCNRLLGLAKDSPELCLQSARYLMKWNARDARSIQKSVGGG